MLDFQFLSLGSHSIYFLASLGVWALFCVYRFANIPTITFLEVVFLSFVSCLPFFLLPRIEGADILWLVAIVGIMIAAFLFLRPTRKKAGTLGSVGYLRIVHFTKEKTAVVRGPEDLDAIDILILSEHQLEWLSQPRSKQHKQIDRLVKRALQKGISIISLEEFLELRFGYFDVHEETTISPSTLVAATWYRLAKKPLEMVLAAFFALVSLPIVCVTAVLVWMIDGSPILYKQTRIGRGDKKFKVIKFRTMDTDDTEIQMPTALGKILRNMHIDELPQLLNVLRGEMALVGPRPEWVQLTSKERAPENYWLRQVVRPGLTGWAQVNYLPSKNKIMRRRKLGYDMFYIKNRSFFLDALIYLRTVQKLALFWRNRLD